LGPQYISGRGLRRHDDQKFDGTLSQQARLSARQSFTRRASALEPDFYACPLLDVLATACADPAAFLTVSTVLTGAVHLLTDAAQESYGLVAELLTK
jgi:hypothetical protein